MNVALARLVALAAVGAAVPTGCALIAGVKDGTLAGPDGGSTGGAAATTSSSSGTPSSSAGTGGSGTGGATTTSSSGTTTSTSASSTSTSSTSTTSSSSSGSTAGMITIPAGSFHMGCNAAVDTLCGSDESPYHVVMVSQFLIDATEVQQADYQKCVAAGQCNTPSCAWDPVGQANYPVICVAWTDALAYCTWAGKRLPTEAEWEKASRADTGDQYPWGAPFNNNCNLVNANLCKNGTDPVMSQPTGASPYGCLNMSGNAAEWVNDWYGAGYYAVSPPTDPQGPAAGGVRVHRGGSWNSPVTQFRCSSRAADLPSTQTNEIGFRCAK